MELAGVLLVAVGFFFGLFGTLLQVGMRTKLGSYLTPPGKETVTNSHRANASTATMIVSGLLAFIVGVVLLAAA